MDKLYKFVGGRSLTFAWFCILAATVLAGFNRLTPAYSLTITALSGFVCWRAAQQDGANNGGAS